MIDVDETMLEFWACQGIGLLFILASLVTSGLARHTRELLVSVGVCFAITGIVIVVWSGVLEVPALR